MQEHSRSHPRHSRRYINTSSSLNNSTLEVTSSGGGHCGENPPATGPVTAATTSSTTARRTTSSSQSVTVPQTARSRQPRFATLNCINGSSNDNDADDGYGDVNNVVHENDDDDPELLVNRQEIQQRPFLCRTPPPNYHSLSSVTPPPLYTPRHWERQDEEQINPGDLPTVGSRIENATQDTQTQRQQHPFPTFPPPPPPAATAAASPEIPALPLRLYRVPEVLGPGIDDNADEDYVFLNGHNINERRTRRRSRSSRGCNSSSVAQLLPFEVASLYGHARQEPLLANESYSPRNVATVSSQHHPQEEHHHQRRRTQRRRKFHLLQQQQQQSNSPIVGNPNNIDSSTDSDSSTSSSDINENFNEDQSHIGTTRDQRRRRRQRLLKLRDAYCPDLLNACSLILLQQQQQQQTSDSTVGSFTDSPAPHGRNISHDVDDDDDTSSSDYVEIPYQRSQATNQIIYETTNRLNGPQQQQQQQNLSRATNRETTAEENQRLQQQQEMGQNLSIRRPRISLTWVLREQQQQQQPQQQTPNQKDSPTKKHNNDNDKENKVKSQDPARLTNNNQVNGKGLPNLEVNQNQTTVVVEKKRYRLKKSATENVEPLNGYATTPTSYTNASTALASQKFFSNQNLLEYHRDDSNAKPPSKDLLFVCTPQRLPDGFAASTEALALVKKRNEIRKKLAAKMAQFRAETQAATNHLNGGVGGLLPVKKEPKVSLKSGSYSEPSLIAASEGNPRRHRHRKRKERNRPPKFGYDIKNVDEFLTKCSLASPANIPMVLSTSCVLYQTRPGGYQTEVSLPLGMVINAVFKNQNWLYVQTPHGEEGYVNYNTCLPLGILPAEARKEGKSETTHTKPKACWETSGDVFPKPCGNMTDSEKEIHLRVGGTRSRSEGARTPHLKSQLTDNADTVTVISVNTDNTDCLNGNTSSIYGEQQVDKLYLRAASQPKLTEKTSYAQLKIIRNHSSAASATSSNHYHQLNDEYVTLQQQQQKSMQKQHVHHLPVQKTYITRTFITNGHNGQHLHPKDMKQAQVTATNGATTTAMLLANNCNNLKNTTATTTGLPHNNTVAAATATAATITVTSYSPNQLQLHPPLVITTAAKQQQQQLQQHSAATTPAAPLHHINNQSNGSLMANTAVTATTTTTVAPRSILNAIRRSSAHCGQRQTLVAITTDYSTGDGGLTLQKGDIVTLCECRETKDHRQWFYVRTRDGRQGYIPAEVAGHGFL